MAAVLVLRGIDPYRHLACQDEVTTAVIARGVERAQKLRQQELDYLARQLARELSPR